MRFLELIFRAPPRFVALLHNFWCENFMKIDQRGLEKSRKKKKHFFLIGVPLRHGVLFRMKFCSIAVFFPTAQTPPLSIMSDGISHSSLVYSCKYIVSLGRRCFDTRWPCIKFLKLFILGLDIKQSAITNAILITIVQMVYFYLMIECGIL